jgi:hypothetical protein
VSHDPLNPSAAPRWRLEGIREILGLVRDLTVLAELHNAHGERRPPLVGDGIFRDPKVAIPENSLDRKARRPARMMTPQGLQILSPEDSFARLRIVASGIIGVNVVFRVPVCVLRARPFPLLNETWATGVLYFIEPWSSLNPGSLRMSRRGSDGKPNNHNPLL